jgi:2-keto-4-pentenoate hydratase/2-oxohepta-3-ene-1,7-dioic acid hydratase in catechol pathway
VVTSDELPPGASGLRICTRVNGETMQDSNTSDMIFSTAKIVAILSEFMTLEPGDLIATGTPSGVAHARKPPAWMKAGDKVEVEVERIGILANPVVDAK